MHSLLEARAGQMEFSGFSVSQHKDYDLVVITVHCSNPSANLFCYKPTQKSFVIPLAKWTKSEQGLKFILYHRPFLRQVNTLATQ